MYEIIQWKPMCGSCEDRDGLRQGKNIMCCTKRKGSSRTLAEVEDDNDDLYS